MRETPSQDVLHELLDYDQGAGTFTWRPRGQKWFRTSGMMDRWNKRFAGQPAMATRNTHGFCGYILGKCYGAHRVAWVYVHGAQPKHIDHIDGDPENNCIANLRSVNHATNLKNQKMRSTNSSGVMGVDMSKGRWRARIKVDGRELHIGRFDSFADAAFARAQAERLHGFHENHGR